MTFEYFGAQHALMNLRDRRDITEKHGADGFRCACTRCSSEENLGTNKTTGKEVEVSGAILGWSWAFFEKNHINLFLKMLEGLEVSWSWVPSRCTHQLLDASNFKLPWLWDWSLWCLGDTVSYISFRSTNMAHWTMPENITRNRSRWQTPPCDGRF